MTILTGRTRNTARKGKRVKAADSGRSPPGPGPVHGCRRGCRRAQVMTRGFLVGAFLAFCGTVPPAEAQADPFGGVWGGAITLPTGELEVQVELRMVGERWHGTIDVPVQGIHAMNLAGVRAWGDSITFAFAGVPGQPTFLGRIQEDRIEGVFSQGGQRFPFHLDRKEAAERPSRPQTPQPPFPYSVEEVTYRNGDVILAGTLTVPAGPGPFPAVVMITGSGAQDRDETIFGHRPFAVIADHLTRGGVAVLRSDDRGVGGSTGSRGRSTLEDFAGDALAGLRLLQERAEIAHDRLGLIGHSEGAKVAALAAGRDPSVAFIVLMAGSGVPLGEVMVTQARLLGEARGVGETHLQRQEVAQRELFRLVEAGADSVRLRQATRSLIEVQLEMAGLVGPAAEETVEQLADQHLPPMLTPLFRFGLSFDPREALRLVRVPVLAFGGTLDLQVPPDENLPEIEKALREAGNQDVTIHELPGLNHLFQRAATGTVEEYAQIEETMAPHVLELILDWIRHRF